MILSNNKLNALLFYTSQKINKKNTDTFTYLIGKKVIKLKSITININIAL